MRMQDGKMQPTTTLQNQITYDCCFIATQAADTTIRLLYEQYFIMLYLFPILIFTKLVFFNVYIKQSIVLTSYMTEINRKKYLNVLGPLYEYFRFQLLSALFERFK